MTSPPLFSRRLPSAEPGVAPATRALASKKPPLGKDKKKPDKPKPVHTQMVGEKPGDPLGYDPKIIPVEDI